MDSELLLTWSLGISIILLFLIPYILKERRKEEITRKRLAKTRSNKQDKPLLQHPIINRSQCIGCGICVSSCPEGDVLGLIDGKATIIHGSHCVGHGLCAENCPVGGIEIGLGDIALREDIPQIDNHYETNIKGVYIIGELSGMALIRNAISHGIKAINHIKKNLNPNHAQTYDVLIIGSGPAGLSATLRAKEVGIRYLCIDQLEPGGTILQYPRQKLTLVQPVELPLFGHMKNGEYTKEQLLDIWKEVILSQALIIKTNHKLTSIDTIEDGFKVHTNQSTFTASKIILALGRRGTPRMLGVHGEELSKVMYQLKDAKTYKNNNILIVGGGDSAVEAAIGLAKQEGNNVTISYRKENFFRLKKRNELYLDDMIRNNKLKVVFNSNLYKINTNNITLFKNQVYTQIENDFVFIFAGGELPFALLKSINIKFGEKVESIA